MLSVMYGMSAHPFFECRFHLPYAVSVAPLATHRDCSEAYLLYRWINLELVYA